MDRPDQKSIEDFVTISGVSESIAIQKLQEHGGDLSSALDAYYAESNENNVPVTHVRAPRRDSMQFVNGNEFRSDFPLLSAGGMLDRLFGTNNPGSLFREPNFFSRRTVNETPFSRNIFEFDRTPLFPDREPFVSHPREVREIPIEVKDGNGTPSSPRHAPTIVDVTDTEHDHGPGISGVVTLDDDDYASENDMPARTTQIVDVSDNDIPARFSQSDYLDYDDIEEQMILAALEASRHDAEEKQAAKSFETGMELVEDTDAEESPLIRQKAERVSSSFEEHPKQYAEHAPLNHSSSTDQDQTHVFSSDPHEEVDRQHAYLPQEPLPDESNGVNILIRMPDGRRLSRRFLKSDKLKVVFDFIQICGGVFPGSYKLARSYPRCTFSDTDGSLKLEEIGLTGKQEALYLELL